eukprot:GCRY01001202.1.p1 GENE.GCRY01001202.1~~GCRY01001202.1.p1  ORF type:complete len:335 (+),score=69.57 GCRY01001202.1:504-1508(+)
MLGALVYSSSFIKAISSSFDRLKSFLFSLVDLFLKSLPFDLYKKIMEPNWEKLGYSQLAGANDFVWKKVIQEGEGEVVPMETWVDIHYTGWIVSTGDKFDSSHDRKHPFTMTLKEDNNTGTIPGWRFGVATMKKGEIAEFVFGPKMGYGALGLEEKNIPPHCVLKYEIEVVSWEKIPKTVEEKLTSARRVKNDADSLVKQGRMDVAISKYLRVVDQVDFLIHANDEQQREADALSLSAHLNLAFCYLKLEHYDMVVDYATKVLNMSQDNVKALFRRGVAYSRKREYPKARTDLEAALRRDAENKQIQLELEKLAREEIRYRKTEKKTYQKMFSE